MDVGIGEVRSQPQDLIKISTGAAAILLAEACQTTVEVGPGKVLSGLMRQIDRNQKTLNVEDSASLDKTLSALAE